MNRISNRIFKIFFTIGGFLGFLGFIPKTNGEPNYLFFLFFSFFSFILYEKVNKRISHEKLLKNKAIASRIMQAYYMITIFVILFLLDRNLTKDIPLLAGVILYTLSFYLHPLLILWLNQKNNRSFI